MPIAIRAVMLKVIAALLTKADIHKANNGQPDYVVAIPEVAALIKPAA
ncbi:hypothetical protein GCM10022414_37710 [Zhongshania borealis]|uniref:Uncharacterized protein n=1 Tax=Zhongshania borealis TaxID=889488 RepID=A0ABP7X7X3_9GAMM